jgi:hypothetical protein
MASDDRARLLVSAAGILLFLTILCIFAFWTSRQEGAMKILVTIKSSKETEKMCAVRG